MAVSQEKTDANIKRNIKIPTTEEMRTRFDTMPLEEKEKYKEGIKFFNFTDLPQKSIVRRLTAAEKAAIDGVLNRRIRKKKRRLVSATKQKNKVATSEKTDDNNNINTPSTEKMGRRFDTMPLEEKMKYIDFSSTKRRFRPFTDAESAAIRGILNGGICKKKKRLVSANKQNNKVATSKKTDDDDNNNINTPSTEEMGMRFDTMPLEEKAVEKAAAIKGDLNGGIRKKKSLVSSRKQKNKVATSKKTKKV